MNQSQFKIITKYYDKTQHSKLKKNCRFVYANYIKRKFEFGVNFLPSSTCYLINYVSERSYQRP